MYRFSKFIDTRRADFWKTYYSNSELLSLFAYINAVLAARIGGYDLLCAYDIEDICNHAPGITKTWVKTNFGEPDDTIPDTGIGTYRYHYLVDASWISIEGISDSHVDPTIELKTGIDYTYSNGVIKSAVLLSGYSTLYITKGQYVSDRLKNHIGTAFGYEREDSYKYRDTMMTLLKLFYDGPTITNLISSIHVLINSPVTKYDNETVLSTDNEAVLTNKYKYELGGAEVGVQIGDIVNSGDPLAGAVEVYTNKLHPNWWKDRSPELFTKFRPSAVMTYEEVDLLMESFLKFFVAHIRINLRKVDNKKLTFYEDIWNLILEGSSIRTDYIISAYRLDEDILDDLVNKDIVTLRLGAFCCWGNTDYNSEAWLYTPRVVDPYIFPDDVVNPYWKVGSHRWHILPAGETVKDFWSASDNVMPYLEPTHDYWYIRNVETTYLPVSMKYYSSAFNLDVVKMFDAFFGFAIDPNPDTTANIDTVDEILAQVDDSFEVFSVYASQNVSHAELVLWTYEGSSHLSAGGAVVTLGSSATIYSPAFNVGRAVKNVKITPYLTLPDNTTTVTYYKTSGDWTILPEDFSAGIATGNVYVKAVLTASNYATPVFRGLDIDLTLLA